MNRADDNGHRKQHEKYRDPIEEQENLQGTIIASHDLNGDLLPCASNAAHANAVNAILVTKDRAFTRIPDALTVEHWIDGNG